jgi:uncharacterized membrane protein YjfL (UPF0719 family)
MKQVDFIRLGIIAIALLLAYNGIVGLIGVIDFLVDLVMSNYKQEGWGLLNLLLKIICFFVASFLLIKNSRKISNFIDEQK